MEDGFIAMDQLMDWHKEGKRSFVKRFRSGRNKALLPQIPVQSLMALNSNLQFQVPSYRMQIYNAWVIKRNIFRRMTSLGYILKTPNSFPHGLNFEAFVEHVNRFCSKRRWADFYPLQSGDHKASRTKLLPPSEDRVHTLVEAIVDEPWEEGPALIEKLQSSRLGTCQILCIHTSSVKLDDFRNITSKLFVEKQIRHFVAIMFDKPQPTISRHVSLTNWACDQQIGEVKFVTELFRDIEFLHDPTESLFVPPQTKIPQSIAIDHLKRMHYDESVHAHVLPEMSYMDPIARWCKFKDGDKIKIEYSFPRRKAMDVRQVNTKHGDCFTPFKRASILTKPDSKAAQEEVTVSWD